MLCRTSLFNFQCLQIIKSDIRPEMKWAVSLMNEKDHFKFPQGSVCTCTHVRVDTFALSSPRVQKELQHRILNNLKKTNVEGLQLVVHSTNCMYESLIKHLLHEHQQ